MAEIIFRSKMDAKRCYDHLLKCLRYHPNNEDILLLEDRHIVKISESIVRFGEVKEAFYEFIIKIKRDDWFRAILQEQYFFEDSEEQEHIIEIIYSVLEGQREDLAVFIKENAEEPKIREAVEEIFQDHVSFSFDSFFKFRLRPYLKLLESYVEISIDEYKMEQEYQMFIQTLRDFLASRDSKMETLHLLFDEEITFFDEQFVEIKRGELMKMIDRKLLFNHPVYVDSASIAPLLSIAPKNIHLYTKNPEEPLVRTIKNIFEERVLIKSYKGLRHTKEWIQQNNSAKENGA
ncbi:putative sporulation protein YtxC [Neobacillus niacini]|uniref:putative sporulation protein YtxC n=1 Tax=Neobacillus driksii TaxID=3035913 RepID=UPI0027811A19|nr:putative sporulation protein YtxC [Neobacillus niacini]MDQ0975588.1 putative sporulation protein YtxC [Neobacillus niacini]